MLKNYFKVTIRNFTRHKSSFLINVLGLAIGMACSILILLWVKDELGHDRFNKKIDRIYNVMDNQHYTQGAIYTTDSTPAKLAAALKEDIPEVEDAMTYRSQPDVLFRSGKKAFKEMGAYAGPDFFNIFSFKLLQGDPDDVLSQPHSVVISQELAQKYFGSENAVGKLFTISTVIQQETYKVTGVYKDMPENSSMHYDFIFPIQDWLKQNEWATHWGNFGPRTVIVLKPGTQEAAVDAKIKNFLKTKDKTSDVELFLQPYGDAYLYNHFENGKQAGGRIDYVYLFTLIAFFVLVIACINFMNLSTARSTRRAREVGIRKSIGASRGSLIGQYLGESLIISFAALILAVLFVELSLPFFNDVADKHIVLAYTDPGLSLLFLAVVLITGLISGSYPAFYLSSFEAVKVLKGTVKSSFREVFARRGLVIIQFTLSLILIISTMIIYQQMQFVQHRNIGYKKENLLYFNREGTLNKNWKPFRQALLKNKGVENVALSSHPLLGRNTNTSGISWPGKPADEETLFEIVYCDTHFLQTMGMHIVAGRAFSKKFATDSAKVIINQAAAKVMNMKKPVGKGISWSGQKGQIIGVVKDFDYQSARSEVKPLVMLLAPSQTWLSFVRIKGDDVPATLASIKATYNKFNPGYPFDYHFMDQQYDKLYRSEIRTGTLSRYFALLAIIISCLGLFGLSAFTAERRTKEMGIRKILGASVPNLIALLSKEFTWLVLASIAIAVPVSWLAMRTWLGGFAFHIDIGWGVFLLAGAGALLIACLTVSWQSIKAALANPVDSLRSE